jgi:hypothetical protein
MHATSRNCAAHCQSIMNNKPIFVSTLSAQFKITAEWRDNNARRYGHDARNAEAARRLLELESEIDISDDTWTRLAPSVTRADGRP